MLLPADSATRQTEEYENAARGQERRDLYFKSCFRLISNCYTPDCNANVAFDP
jgi:hypothetical protein